MFIDLIKFNFSNISLITDELLRDKEIDFYHLLAVSDLLITDFSSIYADYLLIDKPIIFISVDLQNYEEERGLLLNPYDMWMPGPKCFSQEELQNEIKKSLQNKNYFNFPQSLSNERIEANAQVFTGIMNGNYDTDFGLII